MNQKPCQKEGWLKRKEGNFLYRSWVDRWVRLVGNELQVFKNQGGSKPMLTQTLSGDTSIDSVDGSDNCFTVVTPEDALEFCANTTEEMAPWINFLVQASFRDQLLRTGSTTEEEQSIVYSVKGMMCAAHGDTVRAVVYEIEGIEQFKLDYKEELLHLRGQFDRLVVENNLERIGFIVYYEPDISPF